MERENYELRVGLFALFALIILVWGWGWLKSFSPFDPPVVFWVRFHDVAGMTNNATVNIQGVRVGTVDKISFKKPDEVKEAPTEEGEDQNEPRVYLRLKLTGAKVPIPIESKITIQTLGLVGAKYIEITLPDHGTGSGQLIDPETIVKGEDPVRVELVLNSIAQKINHIASGFDEKDASKALKDLSSAAGKLNSNMDRIAKVSESVQKASDNVGVTAAKFGGTAEKANRLADSASVFFKDGSVTFDSVNDLAQGLSTTNAKVGKILDNPAFSKDLKETVDLARQTAVSIEKTVHELSDTVKDKEVRADLSAMLTKIQHSAEQIGSAVQAFNKVSGDQILRDDLKTVVRDAKVAMEKANALMADPAFKADLTSTMTKVRAAAGNVDMAARQVNQVLNKRAPLLRLMFGRPGALPAEEAPKP